MYIQEEAEFLLEITKNHDLNNFPNNRQLQNAVSMVLIKIGESVKSLSEELKQENQEIEWRDIAGLRDIAVHNYKGLRMDDIWRIVTRDVPKLLGQVEKILYAENGVNEHYNKQRNFFIIKNKIFS